jgi:hypothetical protein
MHPNLQFYNLLMSLYKFQSGKNVFWRKTDF